MNNLECLNIKKCRNSHNALKCNAQFKKYHLYILYKNWKLCVGKGGNIDQNTDG